MAARNSHIWGSMKQIEQQLDVRAQGRTWLEPFRRILVGPDHATEPIGTVYLLVDCSASMSSGHKLLQAKLGLLRFSLDAWHKNYAVGIIRFSTHASCLLPASKATTGLQQRLSRLQPEGRTAMADALVLARRKLLRCKGDKVICLITDGKPDDRRATLEAARLARAQGIAVIAVGTDGADEAFLAALAGREELTRKVPRAQLEAGVSSMARLLP